MSCARAARPTVLTTLNRLTPTPVAQLLRTFPDVVDAIHGAGLHLLDGSWAWRPGHELDDLHGQRDPDMSRLLPVLRRELSAGVLQALIGARARGTLPVGAVEAGRVAFIGEVGYVMALRLQSCFREIEAPPEGAAVGWERPLPILGWLGVGEGGSWYFGTDGTRIESDRWAEARLAALKWVEGAGREP